jgi:hypothetical protein
LRGNERGWRRRDLSREAPFSAQVLEIAGAERKAAITNGAVQAGLCERGSFRALPGAWEDQVPGAGRSDWNRRFRVAARSIEAFAAMMELALILLLLPVIGLILGVIAFFRGGAARDEIARLRGEIGLLYRRLEAIERALAGDRFIGLVGAALVAIAALFQRLSAREGPARKTS